MGKKRLKAGKRHLRRKDKGERISSPVNRALETARAFQENGRFIQVEKVLKKALSAAPRNPELLKMCAMNAACLGRDGEAMFFLNTQLAINPPLSRFVLQPGTYLPCLQGRT